MVHLLDERRNILSVLEEFSFKPERLTKELLGQPSVLFNPHRIAIMLELYHAGGGDFPQLRHDLSISDGALATHLRALANEELIESKREQIESRERTTFIITRKGILSLENFFKLMRELSEELQQ